MREAPLFAGLSCLFLLVGALLGNYAGELRVQRRLDTCEHIRIETERQDKIRNWRQECTDQVPLGFEDRTFRIESCVRQKEAEEWK